MGAGASTADAKKHAEENGVDAANAEAAYAALGEGGTYTKALAVQFKLHEELRKAGADFELANDAGKDEPGTFNYIKFNKKPTFGEGGIVTKSAMSVALTDTVFDKYKDTATAKGYTLSNAIQTGCLLGHLGVGCTAGDQECWEVFKDLYYPVIKAWHGYDAETGEHPRTDFADEASAGLTFTDEQKATFEKYVASTRIRAARNFDGFALPCGTNAEDRASVEKAVQDATAAITDDDLKGTYYSLKTMSDEDRDVLLSKGYLFQIPSDRNLLMGAGAARNWPDNRGIFHNGKGEDGKPAASGDATALAWCNEEDHCRIISMMKGGDIPAVFKRFGALSDALAATGAKFMVSDKLGYLGTCPSNLGTGLRGSVMVKLEKFNELLEAGGEGKELLEEVCAKFDLQPRGSAGEHSPAVGAKFDVSNKQRLGFSERDLVQKMIDGVSEVIKLEEMLAEGKSVADVKAAAGIA
jgi:creatine kinase